MISLKITGLIFMLMKEVLVVAHYSIDAHYMM